MKNQMFFRKLEDFYDKCHVVESPVFHWKHLAEKSATGPSSCLLAVYFLLGTCSAHKKTLPHGLEGSSVPSTATVLAAVSIPSPSTPALHLSPGEDHGAGGQWPFCSVSLSCDSFYRAPSRGSHNFQGTLEVRATIVCLSDHWLVQLQVNRRCHLQAWCLREGISRQLPWQRDGEATEQGHTGSNVSQPGYEKDPHHGKIHKGKAISTCYLYHLTHFAAKQCQNELGSSTDWIL